MQRLVSPFRHSPWSYTSLVLVAVGVGLALSAVVMTRSLPLALAMAGLVLLLVGNLVSIRILAVQEGNRAVRVDRNFGSVEQGMRSLERHIEGMQKELQILERALKSRESQGHHTSPPPSITTLLTDINLLSVRVNKEFSYLADRIANEGERLADRS